jgi:hypothetical protein
MNAVRCPVVKRRRALIGREYGRWTDVGQRPGKLARVLVETVRQRQRDGKRRLMGTNVGGNPCR